MTGSRLVYRLTGLQALDVTGPPTDRDPFSLYIDGIYAELVITSSAPFGITIDGVPNTNFNVDSATTGKPARMRWPVVRDTLNRPVPYDQRIRFTFANSVLPQGFLLVVYLRD